MDMEDIGNHEVEDCLWEWATAVERSVDGGQEMSSKVVKWVFTKIEEDEQN